MALNTIYSKTAKGRAEIKTRSGDISMIERRLLIMADGVRDAKKIFQLSRVTDFEDALARLEMDGYLEVVSGASVARFADDEPVQTRAAGRGSVTGTAQSPRPKPAASRAEPAQISENVKEIQELMIQSINSLAPAAKNSPLRTQIANAADKETLKACLDDWYAVLSDNPYALGQAEDLRRRLIEMLL